MVVDMKVFILSTCLTTLNTGELVVNHTVDGEDNQEEKTMKGEMLSRLDYAIM